MVQVGEFESVDRWLNRLSPKSRKACRIQLGNWLDWMKENGGKLARLNPDELVRYQQGADNGRRYDVLDKAQDYVNSLNMRYNSKAKYYTSIRSFFLHNRASLPRDPFKIYSDVPQVKGDLNVEEIRDMVLSSNELYQAIILSMFQAALDKEMFTYWNENGWDSLREQLEKGTHPIRIDLPGRKKQKHKKPFYTFIGKDAIDAIKNYLPQRPDKIKVKVNDDEKREITNPYIFTDQYQRAVSKNGLHQYWLRHLKRLGLIELPEKRGSGYRTGKNLHEMRDTWRSQWSKSPSENFVGEYCMGHDIDPMNYDKSFQDIDFYRNQYLLAEPSLNIISNTEAWGHVKTSELERYEKRIKELEDQLEKTRTVRDIQISEIQELREDYTQLRNVLVAFFEDPSRVEEIKKLIQRG